MPPSKKKVIEQLAEVKNLGDAYATQCYDDLGVRSLEDLVKAAKANELQSIKGIGAAKEAKILASAEELLGGSAPAPTPEKSEPKQPKAKSKPKTAGSKAKPADAKKSKPADAKAAKPADTKKSEPKTVSKPEAPKAEPKKTEAKSDSKPRPNAERPRTTYRPPQPKPRPSIPGLIFKLTKKIIGRLLS